MRILNKAQRRERTAHLQNDAVKRRRVIKSSRLVKKEREIDLCVVGLVIEKNGEVDK